jgi:hypothetical protein
MPIAIVAGALANKPFSGGEAWVRLSWLLGLARLGFDAYFVEEIEASACVDEDGTKAVFEDSVNRRHFEAVTTEFGLSERSALLYKGEEGGRHLGLGPEDMQALCAEAELLVNVSGHLTGSLLAGPRTRVYVDLDPGFTQAWHADETLPFTVAGHDHHLTVGLNIGQPGCPIPTAGLNWIPTLPPLLLDEWSLAPATDGAVVFTTVATWRNPYGGLEIGGRAMGLKHHQFRRLLKLPERVEAARFEIALDIHPGDVADLEALRAHGWTIVDPRRVAATPAAFRDYVRGSGAEFSVAQGVYAESSSGWFSDRTGAYLACGHPALVQETGLDESLTGSGGLLSFDTLEGAVAGAVEAIERLGEHRGAARGVAERHLDSDRVLGRVLERIGVGG